MDVVYGSPGNFQGDLLRHEFELMGTRGERKYDTVIVDEVDNMLIDDAQHITMLSGPMPGFEYLQGLLLSCWNLLEVIDSKFVEKDGQLLWDNNFKHTKDGIALNARSERHDVCLVHNRYEFTTELLGSGLQYSIEEHKSSKEEQFKIPEHLKRFSVQQAENWAKSAWRAKHSLSENNDYVIESDSDGRMSIFSVDRKNTGIVQHNMVLSDGLHQFLQLKHGLRMSAENLVTSFVSNAGFFKRFEKIYGLTGTIGNEDSQALLKEVYGIEIGFMPTFKTKQLKELPMVICNNKINWIDKIADISIAEANKGRAVLIINESIEHVTLIQKSLVDSIKYPKKFLKWCTGSAGNNVEIPKSINSNEIVISTLLASRGTDITTTDSVEQNGGLHV